MNKVPKLALGTWLMGGTKEPDPDNDDQKDIAVIQTAIDNGVTLIDTAQNYADGKCEEIVGEAIKKYPRSSYQILTKQKKAELTFDEVIAGCKVSIKRMGIDYIDYFVCHAPRPDADMTEFFKASNQLYKNGLIKNVGVSNFGPKTLQIALDTSDLPICLNQVSFSMTDQDILTSGTYDFCVKHDIPIQAYRTLTALKDNPKLMELLETVGKTYDASPQQIAIAYINSFENMLFTVRASSKEHWQQIKDAFEITLSQQDINTLRKFHESSGPGAFGDFLTV